eukprot:350754-Chlamydomonas_euryale.AAC.2
MDIYDHRCVSIFTHIYSLHKHVTSWLGKTIAQGQPAGNTPQPELAGRKVLRSCSAIATAADAAARQRNSSQHLAQHGQQRTSQRRKCNICNNTQQTIHTTCTTTCTATHDTRCAP